MATWPTYAKILKDGYSENPAPAVLQTEMETGPTKIVRVKSKVMVARPVTVLLDSAANYASWLTWFQTTIRHGADWFDWTDPRTNEVKSARIQGGQYTAEHQTRLSVWKLSLTLETWE